MDTLLHDYAAKCYAFSTGLVSFQMLHASLQGQIMQTIMKYMTTQLATTSEFCVKCTVCWVCVRFYLPPSPPQFV